MHRFEPKGLAVPTKRTDHTTRRKSPTSHTTSAAGKRSGATRGRKAPSARPSSNRPVSGRAVGSRPAANRPSKSAIPAARRSAPKHGANTIGDIGVNRGQAPQSGNPVTKALDGITNGLNGLLGSFANKGAHGGFSTSYQGTQGAMPSFTSQRASNSDPGELNIEGGAGSDGVLLTRRKVVAGAAALGGVALAGGGISMAIDAFEGSSGTADYISVSEDAITGVDDLKQVKAKNYVTAEASYHLPFGTLVFADNDDYACLLVPGDTSSPLNIIKSMSLSSGKTKELVKKARGTEDGFEIMDARLGTGGLIWTEANTYESSWRIYTASFDGSSLGKAKKVDEGDSNWLTPSIAANGSRAFWQVNPNTDGEQASSPSVVRSATFGSKEYEELITSKRAFATRISCVSEGVVVTPRAESTGTYYQLTLLDAASGQVADTMVLPSNMSPDQASYGRSGFSFGFTDTYNYGGGIANLGTYTPIRKAEAYNYDNLPSWLRYGRTPSADPCWCGDWFCVKSTRGIAGIHFAKKRYFSITVPSDTDDWGEYLVSTGTCKKIVSMAKITPSDNSDPYTLVRVFSTKSGKLGDAFGG